MALTLYGIDVSQNLNYGLLGVDVKHVLETVTLLIQDKFGNPISGASINLNDGEGFDETYITGSGTEFPNENGMIREQVEGVGDTVTITVSKVGYQTYTHKWNVKHFIDWELTVNRIVPVIVLNDGSSAVNTNPSNPNNVIFG